MVLHTSLERSQKSAHFFVVFVSIRYLSVRTPSCQESSREAELPNESQNFPDLEVAFQGVPHHAQTQGLKGQNTAVMQDSPVSFGSYK